MKSYFRLAFLIGIFWFLFISNLQADGQSASKPSSSPPISVKAEVNKAFITIGDPITYTITVRHAPELKITNSFPPPDPEIFKIKKTEDIKEIQGPLVIEGKRFTMTAYQLGDFILDPVQISYLDAENKSQSLQTDKIFVSVKSVASGEVKKDIRGIKSVVKLPSVIVNTIIGVTAFSFLLALSLLLWPLLKRKTLALVPSEPVLTAEEEAHQQLNRLFDSDLIRREKIKEYYLRLTEILKTYFEKRYRIPAAEATTDELTRLLKNQSLDADLREIINEVLQFSDLAKFAKWKPQPVEIIQVNQKAKKIIDLAAPVIAVRPETEPARKSPNV